MVVPDTTPTGPPQALSERRRLALKRWATLEQDRLKGWDSHWTTIAQNLLPRHSRFLGTERNKGGDRNQAIIDSTGTKALRTLAAGMMAGMTSPARPWFRLGLPDKDLESEHAVKVWLDDASTLLLRVFAKSNTYNALHMLYRELGGFGTGLSIVQPNFERIIHHNPMTVGEYALGIDHEGYVDKLGREFKLTVEQAAQWFGVQNLGASARNAYDNSNYGKEITIVHLVEPNQSRDPSKRDNKNMAFKSCYWDKSATDMENWGLLRESGYRRFPALAPRWDLLFGDTYGSSPGMEALGDLMQLQHGQFKKAKAIDYQADPPLQVPLNLKGNNADFLPGGASYYDQNNPSGGIRTAFDVNLDITALREDIMDVRGRVNSAFYVDIFLMLAEADKNMTATEVAERHEEKLLMLGPVLERLHNELLDPLVSMTFARCLEAGLLPPPPEELNGIELQVEFISMLAQAQRAVQVNATDRLIGHIGMIAAGKQDPTVWDKFDGDKSVERYADQLGVDPDLIVPGEKVALVRQTRADQIAAAQQAEMTEKMAGAAAKAGTIQTGPAPENNAASDILNLFSGYQSPAGTEL
jgi:hypothetical protein